MKVRELITLLNQENPDTEVFVVKQTYRGFCADTPKVRFYDSGWESRTDGPKGVYLN